MTNTTPPTFKERYWSKTGDKPTSSLLGFLSTAGVAEYLRKGFAEFPKMKTIKRNKDAEHHEWSGGCTIAQVMERLKYGNPEYTQAFLDGIEDEGLYAEDNTGIGMDVEGVAYDMGAVVEDVPECCLTHGYPEPHRMLKMCVDITFDCSIDTGTIRRRGVAIVNLINTLIQMGYILDVDIMYIHDSHNLVGGRNMYEFFKLNTQTQCISEVAFYMTPEFMRVLCFAITEIHEGRLGGDIEIGGDARGEIEKDFLKAMQEEGTFFIGGSYNDRDMRNLNTQDEANALIVKRFNEFCASRGQKGIPND